MELEEKNEQQESTKGKKKKNTLTKEEQDALGKQRYEEIIHDPCVQPIVKNKYFVKVRNDNIRYVCQMTNAQTAYLYIILLSHRNRNNGICIPSLDLLSRECNLNIRSISRCLKALEEIDAIHIDSGKRGVCNNYKFPLEGFDDNGDEFESKSKPKVKYIFDDDDDEF